MVGDPVGDMLARIRNAAAVGHDNVRVPYSKFKHAVAKVLLKEGYVSSVEKRGRKVVKTIEIGLAYNNDVPKIKGTERVSKPSKRVYQGTKNLRPFRHGFGTSILSTPKGILTGGDARKEHVGGEILFLIW